MLLLRSKFLLCRGGGNLLRGILLLCDSFHGTNHWMTLIVQHDKDSLIMHIALQCRMYIQHAISNGKLCVNYIESSEEEHPSSKEITKQSSSNPIVLKTICEKLIYAEKDWFNLGLAFDLHTSVLKNIEAEHCSNQRRLTEIIDKRLTDSDHPVTWPYICVCLRSKIVGRNDIAEEIETELTNKSFASSSH